MALKIGDAKRSVARVCLLTRKSANDAHMAKVLTQDEARRIASSIAKLPTSLWHKSQKSFP